MKRTIYLDNAATTPVSDTVLESMLPFFSKEYANPSAVYQKSQKPKIAIESSRRAVAKAINAQPNEIFFTSGATEANNWTIINTAFKYKKNGKNHIITTSVEHLSVLNAIKRLEDFGFTTTYLKPDNLGNINLNELENSITEKTFMVSVMSVNNEIGNIFPLAEIGKLCRVHNLVFHTDAVQGIGRTKIDVITQQIDLLTLSAHKFHGPKGIGAVYMKKSLDIPPFIYGGAQERRKRAGTENIYGIVGMDVAIREHMKSAEEQNKKIKNLSKMLTEGLLSIKKAHLIGDPDNKVPHIINIAFENIEGESALLMLDMEGIEASSGSACSSGALAYSHVLSAMEINDKIAKGSIRFSLGDNNTEDDIIYTIKAVKKVIDKLRAISPPKNIIL